MADKSAADLVSFKNALRAAGIDPDSFLSDMKARYFCGPPAGANGNPPGSNTPIESE